MEFRTLRAFVEVVRQGGFSPAAKAVFATQSAVSKAVKQLEDEIGVPLLDRVGHRARLTPAGEIVFPRAVRLLAERDDLLTELGELRGLRRGVLRLGLPPIGSSTIFAPLFARYRELYPGVEVRLVEHGAERLEEMLVAGKVELAASLLPISQALEWQEVRREALVVLLPEESPLAQRSAVDFAALRGVPLVLFGEGFAINRIILDGCRREGFEPDVVARSSQLDFVVELVAAGLGAAFLPQMIAEERRHAGVTFARFGGAETDWRLGMIWRRGAYLSHAARAWLELAAGKAPA